MFAKDEGGKAIIGTLMRIEEDPNSRYRFEIWFDYTRQIMNSISEGAMVIVPNFYIDSQNRLDEWSSVLEITTILPIHYAIAQNQSGFPGFIVEAARSAGQDWIDQDKESTDDTTKIRCIAIPTNIMINDAGNIRNEEGLPMVGHPASLLDTETTERLANLGIDQQRDDVTDVGQLIRDDEVDIYLRVEETLRTHFAVFGFTGAGKSNLLSTLVAKLLTSRKEKHPIKIVLFDLMGEFSTLLFDVLVDLPRASIIAVGPETVPDSVLEYYGAVDAERPKIVNRAALDLTRTSLYPKKLKEKREDFLEPYLTLLQKSKLRIWQERDSTIGEFVQKEREEVTRGNMGGDTNTVIDLVDRIIKDYSSKSFNSDSVKDVISFIKGKQIETKTAKNNLSQLIRLIEQEASADRPSAPEACRVTIPKLVERLNSEDSSSLLVVQAADPDQLRMFASYLGQTIYLSRRRSGQITPLVSFIFDEADEFIPLNFDRESSYANSTSIAMTLARRGRKFGLGIGIATQRVTYLNTNIMAQPHTYFISKLPRKSDRERVCEAFGISEEMFRQTFKFKKGNWLLVSHDATGLESVPLPIRTQNADDRILYWLERNKKS